MFNSVLRFLKFITLFYLAFETDPITYHLQHSILEIIRVNFHFYDNHKQPSDYPACSCTPGSRLFRTYNHQGTPLLRKLLYVAYTSGFFRLNYKGLINQ